MNYQYPCSSHSVSSVVSIDDQSNTTNSSNNIITNTTMKPQHTKPSYHSGLEQQRFHSGLELLRKEKQKIESNNKLQHSYHNGNQQLIKLNNNDNNYIIEDIYDA